MILFWFSTLQVIICTIPWMLMSPNWIKGNFTGLTPAWRCQKPGFPFDEVVGPHTFWLSLHFCWWIELVLTIKLSKSPCVTVSPWLMGLFEKWIPPNPVVLEMAIWGQAPLKDTAAVEELMKSPSFSLLCLKPDYASCMNGPSYNN